MSHTVKSCRAVRFRAGPDYGKNSAGTMQCCCVIFIAWTTHTSTAGYVSACRRRALHSRRMHSAKWAV